MYQAKSYKNKYVLYETLPLYHYNTDSRIIADNWDLLNLLGNMIDKKGIPVPKQPASDKKL